MCLILFGILASSISRVAKIRMSKSSLSCIAFPISSLLSINLKFLFNGDTFISFKLGSSQHQPSSNSHILAGKVKLSIRDDDL